MSFNVKVVSCQFQFAQKCNNEMPLFTHSTQYPLLFPTFISLVFPNWCKTLLAEIVSWSSQITINTLNATSYT